MENPTKQMLTKLYKLIITNKSSNNIKLNLMKKWKYNRPIGAYGIWETQKDWNETLLIKINAIAGKNCGQIVDRPIKLKVPNKFKSLIEGLSYYKSNNCLGHRYVVEFIETDRNIIDVSGFPLKIINFTEDHGNSYQYGFKHMKINVCFNILTNVEKNAILTGKIAQIVKIDRPMFFCELDELFGSLSTKLLKINMVSFGDSCDLFGNITTEVQFNG